MALFPHFASAHAPNGQLPGFATAHGVDAGGPFRFFLCAVVLTVAMPLLLRPLFGRLRPSIAAASWAGSLWFAGIEQKPWWVIGVGAAGTLAAFVLRDAKALRFRRADAVLVPVFAVIFMALVDIKPAMTVPKLVTIAGAIILVVRAVAGSAEAFAVAPLAMLVQTHASPLRHNGWVPLAIAVITPVVLRFFTDGRRRSVQWAMAWIVYPLVTLAFASAASVFAVEQKPRGDLFEDSHSFVPASEMLRGEKLYRDIVPTHGLVEDGLLQYVIMRVGAPEAGRVATVQGYISMLSNVAGYALATAATGSASIGILTYFLAVSLGLAGGKTRFLAAIAALVLMVVAARKGRPRLLAAAGALVVVAGLISLDFGVYSLTALAVTVTLFPASRRAALLSALAGLGVGGGVALLLLTLGGIVVDFFRTTFGELLPASAVYGLGISIPSKPFPEVLSAVVSRPEVFYLALPAGLILFAAVRDVRVRILAAFETVAGLSYVERHHLYYLCVFAPLIALTLTLLFRRSRPMAMAMLAVVIVVAQLTGELATLVMVRTARAPLDPTLVEVTAVPRARGTLYASNDARTIEGVDRYLRERMGTDDTFYDFADRGNLFFLLDRDDPVRFVEVSFAESESAQRDVIARIQRNWHVRAALVPAGDATAIDGVPNRVRAPLIWKYLQENFEPDVAAGEVVIWRRLHFGAR